jgi:hypothetical protein
VCRQCSGPQAETCSGELEGSPEGLSSSHFVSLPEGDLQLLGKRIVAARKAAHTCLEEHTWLLRRRFVAASKKTFNCIEGHSRRLKSRLAMTWRPSVSSGKELQPSKKMQTDANAQMVSRWHGLSVISAGSRRIPDAGFYARQ